MGNRAVGFPVAEVQSSSLREYVGGGEKRGRGWGVGNEKGLKRGHCYQYVGIYLVTSKTSNAAKYFFCLRKDFR